MELGLRRKGDIAKLSIAREIEDDAGFDRRTIAEDGRRRLRIRESTQRSQLARALCKLPGSESSDVVASLAEGACALRRSKVCVW
jgi:hypothetical protein